MAVTEQSYIGNGSTTNYSFTFPYLKSTDIQVQIDAAVTTAWSLANATTVQFNTAPANGAAIKILRDTNVDNLTATFYAGSAIKSEDLNDNYTQNLYVTQEIGNRSFENTGTSTMIGNLNMGEDTVIKFEGATDNAYETTLTVTDPTADRTITLPNVTGTVVTTGDTGTVATGMIANDAINADKIADDVINSEHYAVDSIDTEHYAPASVDTAALASNSVETAKIATNAVTTAKIAADAITGAKIADDSIDSEHYVADSIDTEHYAPASVDTAALATSAVETAKIAADAVNGDKIADDSIDSEHYVDGSIDTAHIANSQVTLAKLAADSVDGTKIADDSINSEHYVNDSIDTEHYAPASVDTAALATGAVETAKIAANAVTTAKIADAELTTLAGMQSGTASILAGTDALTATTTEINTVCDGKSVETTISNTDAAYPTSGAVVDYVAAQIAPIGGLEVIADEDNFPTSIPASGVVISIADVDGIVINGSGVCTTARTAGNGSDNVTINGFPTALRSKTLSGSLGLMVSSTGSSNTYNYHKLLGKEDDIEQLSQDISDFAARYRVASSAPSSNNDSGDLYWDTSSNELKVYNSGTSAWEDVASSGNFYINTLSTYSGTGGNSASFNGSAYRFTISNPPSDAAQLLVSINGVIQQPNTGTSQPTTGFAINGATIVFASAPASGSDFFIITIGSAVSIGTPSNNTVTTAILQNLAVTTAKIAADAVDGTKIADDAINSEHYTDGSIDTVHIADVNVTQAKIADQAINEAKLQVSNAPTNGYVLTAQSGNTGGMTWELAAAGATGGNSNSNGVFWENQQTVTHDYTIQNNYNAGSFGPITINSGITVTVGAGESWTVI